VIFIYLITTPHASAEEKKGAGGNSKKKRKREVVFNNCTRFMQFYGSTGPESRLSPKQLVSYTSKGGESAPLLGICALHHIQDDIVEGMGVTMRPGSDLARNAKDMQRKSRPLKTPSSTTATTTITTSTWTSLSISTIANTTNAILGVSIFAMPWGFQQSGLLGGSIITIIVAFLSFETIRILLLAQKTLYQRTGEVKSYPEIATSALGPSWSSVVQMATVVSCLGGCVGYLIFLGEITSQLFNISLQSAVLAASVPLILLSWIRSFRELTLFTVVGCGAILLAIWAIIFDGSARLKSHGSSQGEDNYPLFAPSTSLNFLGPSTFTFTIHYVVLSMGAESVANKTNLSVNITTAHPSSVSVASSISGLASATLTTSSIMTHVDTNDETNDSECLDSVEAGGVSAIIESASGLLESPNAPFLTVTQNNTAHVLTRPLLMSYVISSLVVIFFGIAGVVYFGDVELVRDSQGDVAPGCEDHVCQNVILNLSAGNLKTFVGFSLILAIVLSYVLILAPAREHIELALLRPFEESSTTAKELLRNIIRASLVLVTAFVAIRSPYFGSMLGAVGGLTDALQSFVLPPVIFLRIFQGKITTSHWLLYHIIILWGIATIIYTTLSFGNKTTHSR